jgi:hypothetical protein
MGRPNEGPGRSFAIRTIKMTSWGRARQGRAEESAGQASMTEAAQVTLGVEVVAVGGDELSRSPWAATDDEVLPPACRNTRRPGPLCPTVQISMTCSGTPPCISTGS